MGIQRQADTGGLTYHTDRASPPANNAFTPGRLGSTRVPRWVLAKRRAPEVLEQSGAPVPALPFALLGKRVTSSTFTLSYVHYSLTRSRTCQLPLRVMFTGLELAGRSVVQRPLLQEGAAIGGARLGAAVPAQHQFCRSPSAALEMLRLFWHRSNSSGIDPRERIQTG